MGGHDELGGAVRRREWNIGIMVLALLFVLLVVPALWFSPEKYSAWAAGIGAFFVAGSLVVAAMAIMNDNAGRRLDRTLELHEQFVSGDLQAARRRLGNHLRAAGHDGRVYQPTPSELRSGGKLGSYGGNSSHVPNDDVSLIIRYFERAYETLRANSVDQPFFLRTIGREACWWARALERDWSSSAHQALQALAQWANAYEARLGAESIADWGEQREADFPSKGA
jgi:hypothetical protein